VAGPGDVDLEALVVTVDGPAGAGKSTVARAVARRLGLRYLDTGAMYRAVTWAILEAGIDPDDRAEVAIAGVQVPLAVGTDVDAIVITVGGIDVAGPIRGERVSAAVSAVSSVPEVRAAMVARQREMIGGGGIVVEGRDIGTTVAPEAPVKIFLTAAADVRSQRRAAELGTGFDDLARRDALDSGRTVSPLSRAWDAEVVDTTDHTVGEVIDTVLELVAKRTGIRV
jgi:cytidylate kinase